MTNTAQYLCPLCQQPLVSANNQYACDNRHSFDIAKEGYVNLLPVQMKKSLQPGDDKNMVLARREFLQLDHYQFLQQAVNTLISDLKPEQLLDLGCGEGYYTQYASDKNPDVIVYGIDISKSAVRYAAKRSDSIHYSVGTIAQLPFADRSIDCIINLFAPITDSECHRVLPKSGHLIRVSPGAEHLLQLKQFIYKTPDLHPRPKTPEGFTLTKEQDIQQTVVLADSQAVSNLLTMTPFGWKLTEETKSRILQALPLKVTFSFTISCYQPIT